MVDKSRRSGKIGPTLASPVEEVSVGRKKGSIDKPRTFDAEELRKILKPIYDKLIKSGVPEERLPANEALVSHILEWVNDVKVNEWIDGFSKLEKKR